MKTTYCLLIGCAVTVLLPAAAMPQTAFDYAKNYDFSRLKTFAFAQTAGEETDTTRTTTYDSSLVKQRVQSAIAAQLEARGIRQDNEHPDTYVKTRSSFRTEQVFYGGGWGSYGLGYGSWGYGGWGYGGPIYSDEILKGSLIVDLEDARTGALVWRGIRENTVHPNKDPEERSEKVFKVVAKIFKKFPRPGIAATSGNGVPRGE